MALEHLLDDTTTPFQVQMKRFKQRPYYIIQISFKWKKKEHFLFF